MPTAASVQKTDNNQQFDEAYARYLDALDSGQSFVYAQRSHAGRTSMRGRGWLKQTDEQTARLLVLVGQMIQARRELLDVGMAIVRSCNPHASRAEWCAKLFESAGVALAQQYDDVDKRTGPEPCRLSEATRPYTRAEKLIVIECLRSISDDYIGVGWAADRCAQDLGVRHIIRNLTGN